MAHSEHEYPVAPPVPLKGRGAVTNLQGRYERDQRQQVDDGWIASEDVEGRMLKTQVFEERAKSILTRNSSPDIPFSVSLNPYRGCEHVMRHCTCSEIEQEVSLSNLGKRGARVRLECV